MTALVRFLTALVVGLATLVYFSTSVIAANNGTYSGEMAATDGAYLGDGNRVEIVLTVDEAGVHNLEFDYLPLSAFMNPEFSLSVNGQTVSYRVVAPILWQQDAQEFSRSALGHEQLPQPIQVPGWHTTRAYPPDLLQISPLAMELHAGENTIAFVNIAGEMHLGDVRAITPQVVPTYQQYRDYHSDATRPAGHFVQGAERPAYFNTSFIRPFAVQHPDVYPYSSRYMLLNAFGGDAWYRSGQSVTYRLYVDEAGLYNLSLQMQQNSTGVTVFRTILINGEVPFEKMWAYAFPHTRRFTAHTLSDENSTPFYFYFQQGWNEITLVASAAPVMDIVAELVDIRGEINQLAITLRRLTGGRADQNRDWQILHYIPDVVERFDDWIARLEAADAEIARLYNNPAQSGIQVDMRHILRRLTWLRNNPHELPFRLSELSEGMTSAGMMLAHVESSLMEQPLALDRIHVHNADAQLPQPTGIFRRIWSIIAQFFASFTATTTRVQDDYTLEVWVARSQWHVEVLQHLVDTQFTTQTGIPVQISLIPEDSNIILANAGGRAPDVAMGVSVHLPFQMAIRGASVDLTQFEGFPRVASRFSPGAFLPLMYEDGVFGLPETQDFNVIFYRRDLMDAFEIDIPDTWDDVIGILPDLARFGANFHVPLSGPDAHKPFAATASFIYQFGGDLYSENGLTTAINREAAIRGLTLMTDLYTLYSIPLQVANFYNDFRNGTIPIGIGNMVTYIMLTNAAPELTGQWGLAPHPGVMDEDGVVQRWATGTAQSVMIMSQSNLQEEAFVFLDWWTSTEAQTQYAQNMLTVHGPAWLWGSANVEAFGNLPIPPEHRNVILEQWEFLIEVPLTPASYIIERELSNIWNRVVFDGEGLRLATDRSVTIINREMRRRMEHFGYFEGGEIVRHYRIPTLEQARLLGGGHE